MSVPPTLASRLRTVVTGCLLFGAGVAAGFGWHEADAPPSQPTPAIHAAPTPPSTPAPTPMPTAKSAEQRTTLEATIEPTPDGLFWATPRLAGREVRFLVQPGQAVRQDTPLLVQDHPGANPKEVAAHDRREALLNLTIAKRRCELAERELQRAIQANLAANAIDRLRVEVQVAKDRCDAAAEQVKKAQLHEEIAEFEKNLKMIESPFAGIVLKVEGARGQTSANGVGVCVLNPAIVQVPCVLPAREAQALKPDGLATITPLGQTKAHAAKITGRAPRLLPGNKFDEHTWTVWLEVRNAENDPALYPGQRVTVQFTEERP